MSCATSVFLGSSRGLASRCKVCPGQIHTVEVIGSRWIELPASVLLFLLVPGDPESGAVYVLDRKPGTWYAVDFEDEQFGGYSVAQLESLLIDCKFLDLIERPGLWRTALRWVVIPGIRPEAAV